MNLSYVILACIAPIVVLILVICGAPEASAKVASKANVVGTKPIPMLPGPTTDKYSVPTEGKFERFNHLDAGSFKVRTEVSNDLIPYSKSKAQIFEDSRAMGWSHNMQNPLRNLNDAQATMHEWDTGEASNYMGNVEIQRPKPFVPKTERGTEESSLRMNGVVFHGQDGSRDIGVREQPKPRRGRFDDSIRPNLKNAARPLAFPNRGIERLRPTQRDRLM